MNPHASREETLFLAAAEIAAPPERAAFLERECADDPSLRRRVEALLDSHSTAGGFLESAAPALDMETEFARLKPEEEGERIAHYKLIEQIGEGGFGAVWLAEQEHPVRRRVALKILKLGMDTKEVIARFEQERQALAMMDHPNIAKVFDAGATRFGRPFFVMEFVSGVKITDYCDEARVPVAARLQLFIAVCQAVQHAHQKGIIHRDLKPSNILVSRHDGVAVPKVIDFGIAKATGQERLTERTICTEIEQFIGTPAYVSPEQATMSTLDIDTRSDIYSLGVVLYELLTGRTPFDGEELRRAGLDEMRRTLRGQEPPRPSTVLHTLAPEARVAVAAARGAEGPQLVHSVRGDLDWVVMRCLEKDRTRRYETANGLAMDVQRHLDNEPILARPPSAAYRLRKMMQRNKLAFAASSAVAVALLVGIGASTWQAIRATRAESTQASLRARAEANEQQAVREREATRHALAKSQLALAESGYREQDGPAIRAALDGVPQDLRESNWNYLQAKSDTSLASLRSHFASPLIATVAPHPRQPGVFAVAGMNFWVALVEARTGRTLLEFPPNFPDAVHAQSLRLAFSPDGERLAIGKVGLSGGTIAIYDTRDGRKLMEWKTDRVDSLEFSPDGRQVLEAIIYQQINLRAAATGQILWTQAGPFPRAVFDPSGQAILVAFNQKLKLLNAQDGTLLRQLPEARDRVRSMAIRSDGMQALIGEDSGFVLCVDLATGRIVYEMRANDRSVSDLAYLPQGDRFVTLAVLSGERQSLQVWDAETGMLLQTLLGGAADFNEVNRASLSVHPLSEEIIAVGRVTKLWNLTGQRELRKFGVRANSFSIAFGKTDDWLLAPGTFADVELLDLRTPQPMEHSLWKPESVPYRRVSVSADGRLAAVGQRGIVQRVHLLHLQDEGLEGTHYLELKCEMDQLELSPAGDRLWNGLSVVDSATGAVLVRMDRAGTFSGYLPARWINSTHVIEAVTAKAKRGQPGSEEQLILWDTLTGLRVRTVTSRSVPFSLAVAPDGRTFAEAGADRMVRLRDARTLEVSHEFRAHDGPIMALAFHPTQPVLATASEDLTIKLWNLDTGRLVDELRGPLAAPIHLAFSPTGQRLACLASDRTVRLWEPASLQPGAKAAEAVPVSGAAAPGQP